MKFLAHHDIAVCAHLGLKPQSVHKTGGFRVQGREQVAAGNAGGGVALEAAGADMVLLECIPSELGREITQALRVPVIGIGAGPHTDGQILVLYDILDITPGRKPRFVRNFITGGHSPSEAVADYVRAVSPASIRHLSIVSDSGPAAITHSMQTLTTIAQVRACVSAWRVAGLSVGFVPTMGNLHDGHQSLLLAARQRADRVIASIFVNPLQFGPGEDFAAYPRTPDEDAQLLQNSGCDVLFAPEVAQMYPQGGQSTLVRCAGYRRSFAANSGPATLTAWRPWWRSCSGSLLPDFAVFGEKDFQQLMVVRRMTLDLSLPIEIVAAPTMRAADGLALSSRNRYLTPAERASAPACSRRYAPQRRRWRRATGTTSSCSKPAWRHCRRPACASTTLLFARPEICRCRRVPIRRAEYWWCWRRHAWAAPA